MKYAKWILALLAIMFATAAYPPSKATLSLAPPTVAPGGVATATLCGFDPGETIVLSLAGLVVVTTVAGADGCATVSFTVSFDAGAVTVTAAGQSSGQSATSILTIQASAPIATTTTTATAAGSAGKSPLPTTGRSVNQTLRAAGGLVVAGVGVLVVSVRRQSDRDRRATRRRAGSSSLISRRR